MKRALLLGACALTSCVTERIIERPAPPCDPATGANCPAPQPQLSERERAELGFEEECGKNAIDACVQLGKLLLQDGNLARAEVPLRKAYQADSVEGTLVLAQTYEQEGRFDEAKELRWEAPAVDKAPSETFLWYRPGLPGGNAYAIAVNLQPMAFFARRLDVGFEVAFTERGVNEVGGFAGYQHFFTEHVVGYAQALLGDLPMVTNGALDYGADVGVRLVASNIGSINIGFGASRGSYAHLQLGISFNSVALLIPVILALSK